MTVVRLLVVGLLGLALGCGGGGSASLAPTVTAPAGCSGTPIENIEVNFSGRGSATGILIQLFGKTFDRQIAASESFKVTENVVPCNYELTGQMLGRTLGVGFSRTTPFTGPFNPEAGIEKGSVVVDAGPNPVFGSAQENCNVQFRQPSTGPAPPYTIKIRFRVSTSNAVGGQGGGCG